RWTGYGPPLPSPAPWADLPRPLVAVQDVATLLGHGAGGELVDECFEFADGVRSALGLVEVIVKPDAAGHERVRRYLSIQRLATAPALAPWGVARDGRGEHRHPIARFLAHETLSVVPQRFQVLQAPAVIARLVEGGPIEAAQAIDDAPARDV